MQIVLQFLGSFVHLATNLRWIIKRSSRVQGLFLFSFAFIKLPNLFVFLYDGCVSLSFLFGLFNVSPPHFLDLVKKKVLDCVREERSKSEWWCACGVFQRKAHVGLKTALIAPHDSCFLCRASYHFFTQPEILPVWISLSDPLLPSVILWYSPATWTVLPLSLPSKKQHYFSRNQLKE